MNSPNVTLIIWTNIITFALGFILAALLVGDRPACPMHEACMPVKVEVIHDAK